MKENESTPQSYEEMIKAAQEQAIKLAQEQMQASLANIPGVQMPNMSAMMQMMQGGTFAQEQLQGLQAQMQEAMNNSDFLSDNWDINRKNDNSLTGEQLYWMAFGAPIFVYNSEFVDTLECQYDTETIKDQMNEWWGIQDRDSTLEIVRWLFDEGHHDQADVILGQIHANDETLPEDVADKAEDVYPIVEYMLDNQYCTRETLPTTVIAWDLVRVINVARWTYQCGYIDLPEVWQIMRQAVDVATRTFSSWEEYGLSFALGRGVWHGEEDDCQPAYEVVTTLLNEETSPWKQITWAK